MPKTSSVCLNRLLEDDEMKDDVSVIGARASIGEEELFHTCRVLKDTSLEFNGKGLILLLIN